MLTRVLSGAVLILLLIGTLLFSGVPFVLNAIAALLAGAGIYELLRVSGLSKHREILIGAVTFTSAFVFCSDPLIPHYRTWLTAATLLLIFVSFAYYLKKYGTLRPENVMFLLMMTLLVSYFFSAIVLTRRCGAAGVWHLILIFLVSWIPDTGAYFSGVLFGKHKLAPVISPKKTVEGAVGGWIVCILITLLYGWLVGHFAHAAVHYPVLILCAVIGTPISILGDLTASLIKRQYNVKDYSNLIPGHGGIMDRFDSVWFVAPFVYLLTVSVPAFSF